MTCRRSQPRLMVALMTRRCEPGHRLARSGADDGVRTLWEAQSRKVRLNRPAVSGPAALRQSPPRRVSLTAPHQVCHHCVRFATTASGLPPPRQVCHRAAATTAASSSSHRAGLARGRGMSCRVTPCHVSSPMSRVVSGCYTRAEDKQTRGGSRRVPLPAVLGGGAAVRRRWS